LTPWCFGQFVRSQILTCAMPDVEYPNHLALFVHFIEDSPDTAPFTKNEAANFPSCRVSFAGEGTAAGHVFKRVEAIQQFAEPLGSTKRGTFNYPIVYAPGVGFCGVSESDAPSRVWL
jgi:hypothetical protein